MIRYANERVIRRNGLLGRILTFGGLGVLVLGLVLSVAYPAQVNAVLGIALVGVLSSQFGMVFYNRWSRRPRMDEVLDDSVKGLDGRYALFHYTLSSPHVLATPAGVFALVPRLDEGEVAWEDGVWRLTRTGRGGPKTRLIRGIEAAAQTEADAAAGALRKRLPGQTLPEVKPMLVFLNPKATLHAKQAPLLAIHAKKLKEALRQLPKGGSLSEDQLKELASRLGLTTTAQD
jgi:hypothetical protein